MGAIVGGPAETPTGPSERWSMDFVHDAFTDGRPFRVLTVVDQWSCQSPLLEVGTGMSGRTVAEALDRVLGDGTTPRSITVDHGTEFTSRAVEDRDGGVKLPRASGGRGWVRGAETRMGSDHSPVRRRSAGPGRIPVSFGCATTAPRTRTPPR